MHLSQCLFPPGPRSLLTQCSSQTHSAARRRTLPALLLAALLSLLGGPAARAAEPLVAVANAVPPAGLLRSAHLLGRQSPNTPVSAGLVLPLRNRDALHALLQRQYDPKDPLYGKFLSAAEFTQRFSPTQADYEAVVSFARVAGPDGDPHAGRTLVGVSGPSGAVERAFHVHLNQYRMPEGRLAYANDAAPEVPASIAARLSGIVGLDSMVILSRTSAARCRPTCGRPSGPSPPSAPPRPASARMSPPAA